MKHILLVLSMALALSACATNNPKVAAPSTAGVKSKVSEASGNVSNAKAASERSSAHIRTFRNKADLIDYKATRALELL